MSAHISLCYTCPRCGEGMTSIQDVLSCPGCGLPLGKMDLEPYVLPYTLSEQHLKYENPGQFISVLAEMPIEKANNIMNDALVVIENISGKKNHIADIGIVVQMGIRIGEIAKAYEAFFQAGGKHHPSHYFKPKEEEIKNEPKDRVGKEPPTATPLDGGGGEKA